MRISKSSIWFPSTAVVALALLNSACYRRSEFRGGLDIEDNGVFTYYRYYARVGRFPLVNGDYTFKPSGFPSELFTLELSVDGGSEARRRELTSLPANVAVSITDASGSIVCRAGGSLDASNGVAEHKWVLSTGRSDAFYWNSGCEDIRIRRHRRYDITVHVSKAEHLEHPYEITLTLAGGGNELP